MPHLPNIATNGAQVKPSSNGTSNGHLPPSQRRTLEQVLFRHKPKKDFLEHHRAMGKLMSVLQHDTPERDAILKLAGVKPDELSTNVIKKVAESFFRVVDQSHASELFALPWHKLEDTFDNDPQPIYGLNTTRLSDVMEQDTNWLWWQRIPISELSMISGDPDLGKTWLVLDIVSRITTGRPMPDGSPNPHNNNRRDVLWCSAEDSDARTVKPRLLALGADTSRVHSLQFVLKDNKKYTLSLKDDVDVLKRWLHSHPLASLIVIDPISAFLGKTDSHRNNDVRQLLQPVYKLANDHQVAILSIDHLCKSDGGKAMYRTGGSIGFTAAPRAAWMVLKCRDEPNDRRLFLKIKNNLEEENVGGLAFRVGPQHKGIFWEKGIVPYTADDYLSLSSGASRAAALTAAKEWLKTFLESGDKPASDVFSQAKAAQIKESTIRKASKELGVVINRIGGAHGYSQWGLPKATNLKSLKV